MQWYSQNILTATTDRAFFAEQAKSSLDVRLSFEEMAEGNSELSI